MPKAAKIEKVTSMLYISRSLLRLDDSSAVDDLVAVSRLRNAPLHVTGALIFTGRHFAQLLEGPAASIDTLMTSIQRDNRHKHVQVLRVMADAPRRFPGWSLAYWGNATFVNRLITALQPDPVSEEQRTLDLGRLDRTILQMAIRGGGKPIGQ